MNMASDLEIHDAVSSSTLSSGSDRHFRTLAESLPQIVWLASADCCVGYQNRRWCEYTGLSSAGSLGFGWKRAFHAADLPETLKRWERAVREGEPCELAFRLRRSDGVYRWFQGRAEPLLDDENRPVGWFAVCGESDDPVRAEQSLRPALTPGQRLDRKLLEKVLAIAPSYIYVFDIAARRNVYGNQEARNSIGYSADELAAMGSELLSTLMHPADLARFDEHLARLDSAQDDDVLEFEYRMRHKDGSWRWFRSRDAVFDRSSAGRPTSIVGVATEITERKNHEQALRRNEDRHRALIAHASQTIWIADAGGKVLEAGAWLEAFTGDAGLVDRDGEWWLPHVHPDDQWQIRMARDRALRDREPFAVQIRVRRRDGEFGWLALRGVPLFEQDGTLREWVGTLQDITVQKRATEAIIASEKHLRRVLDSLFIFVGVLTPEGTLIEANKAPLEAAALSPADVLGKVLWDTYWFNHSPEVQEQLRAAIDRANRGEPSRYDVDVRLAGGVMMTIDFMLVPLRDEAGQIQFLISSAVDISERKQAEKALRQQNERLRLLWETAGILFSTDNSDAMIQGLFEKISDHLRIDTCLQYMVNEQADALCLQFCTGVPADALPSLSRLDFGQAICGGVAQSRHPFMATFIQQTEDARVQLVKAFGIRTYACNPLIANGQVLGTLSFGSRSRDRFNDDELEFMETITNYVTVAYERMRLLSQLHERDRRKNEFMAMLAHELRNPLAPIRNAVQYLSLKGLSDPDVNWASEMIDRQVTNLVHLIDDLLEISRITRGKIQLHKELISLSSVLSHAVEAVQPAISEKRHVLNLDLSSDALPVFGDPTRLEQIFVNLLANAAKYTDDGGFIDVIARRDGDRAVVRVRDNGIGIPPEMLGRIFEPFAQVDQSLDRSKGGLGIGLTLVKSLAEMHGGSVLAASAGSGLGSEFTLWLPLAREVAEPARNDHEPLPSAVAKQLTRILVVEDNPDAATGIGKLLSTCGFDVKIAHDGKAGIALARSFRPEVVLLDIGLPGMSGYEVVRAFRELPELHGLRLIAVSGYGQEADRIRSREAGFEHHFVKPVDFEALKAYLRRPQS
jgi:PAS domain S-box-containing protein